MKAFLLLFAETAMLIVVVSGIQFIVLAFRNPFRPPWLNTSLMENVATVGAVIALSVTGGYQIASLVQVGLSPVVTLAVFPAIVLGVAYANWRLFDCRERLRRADAGQSPFYRVGRSPAVPGAPLET